MHNNNNNNNNSNNNNNIYIYIHTHCHSFRVLAHLFKHRYIRPSPSLAGDVLERSGHLRCLLQPGGSDH